ncbi:hypothetical protein AMECASPLE_036274 [Ameca splendens]|uniref:Uncharacterized protein n=1 Tax=Ameca splendens TaxID=208324 RepID=A0ABV0YWA0_9TELE
MLTIHSSLQTQVCLPLRLLWVINHHLSLQMRKTSQSLLSTITSADVSTSGQTLHHTSEQNQKYADRKCRPAPQYSPGQKVWLSSRDIQLKSMSQETCPTIHQTL